jgi:hypothetical protein
MFGGGMFIQVLSMLSLSTSTAGTMELENHVQISERTLHSKRKDPLEAQRPQVVNDQNIC